MLRYFTFTGEMFKYLFHLLLMLLVSANARTQDALSKTSSEWQQLIEKSKPDTARVELFCKLGAWHFAHMKTIPLQEDKNLDSSIAFYQQAFRLADSLHTDYQWEFIRRSLGTTYFLKENIIEGEKFFMEIIHAFQKNNDKKKEAETWLLMSDSRDRNENSYPAVLGYLKKAKDLYGSINRPDRQAKVQLKIADLEMNAGKLGQAEIAALQALGEYEAVNYPQLYDTYYMLSVINRYQGDLDQSLLYASRCVENFDSTKDPPSRSVLYFGELALVYDGLEQPAESAKWYKETLLRWEKEQPVNIFIYRTAGLLIQQLVKIKKGADGLRVMEELKNKYPPSNPLEKAAVAQNFGYCYQSLGQFTVAERYFLDMIRQYEVTKFQDEFTSKAYEDIGNFYLVTGEYHKSLLYLSKAQSSPSLHLISRQRDIYHSKYKADSAMGNYLAALNDFRNYKKFTDSLFSERKSRQVEELQIKFQTEKKEKDIILLNALNKSQESKLQRSAMIRNLIIAGVLVLAGLIYYRYRIKSISNKKLEEQQRLINQKNQTLTQLVTEKEWLVKEIHHRVKNNFHMVIGLLATQSEFLKSPEAISAMRESRHRINAMSLIHQKLYQSDNLSTISMPGYVHELVNYLKDSLDANSSVRFSIEIDPVELDLSHAIPLGLILNEAITNSIKYAFQDGRDGIIEIIFKEKQENEFIVTVRDNGKGMQVIQETPKDSMGMKLMKGLSEDMDAILTIGGTTGTTIQIEFHNGSDKNGKS